MTRRHSSSMRFGLVSRERHTPFHSRGAVLFSVHSKAKLQTPARPSACRTSNTAVGRRTRRAARTRRRPAFIVARVGSPTISAARSCRTTAARPGLGKPDTLILPLSRRTSLGPRFRFDAITVSMFTEIGNAQDTENEKVSCESADCEIARSRESLLSQHEDRRLFHVAEVSLS